MAGLVIAKNRVIRAVQAFDALTHQLHWHNGIITVTLAEVPYVVAETNINELLNEIARLTAALNMMRYKLLRQFTLIFPNQALGEVEQPYNQGPPPVIILRT